ncbi:GTP cyclohydrolase I [Lacibacter sp.]|uniref:GTP cyclohydrolase I n=1 Tax=Lacibacter sp. TaxID=1915409 RepID=UPI002B4B345F|nr:GTP cyclohydrolase I [Lacibacter sp.]HLP39490.1 GTP cyclohydrolase I [Lacibacter sp.]
MNEHGRVIRFAENEQPAENMATEHYVSKYLETALRADAFDMNNEQKIDVIATHFREILHTLGLDPRNRPSITLFENKYRYNQMLVEKNISFYSNCEHHFVPFMGKLHVGYFSSGKVIGLSKIHRVVKYYANRPQVQERLTVQISKELQEILETKDVAVLIDAAHLCVASRGVNDSDSRTVTACYDGRFQNEETKSNFLSLIK